MMPPRWQLADEWAWMSVRQVIGFVMFCESHHTPRAVGDHGRALGLFQIRIDYHPEVAKAEARDPLFAIRWATPRLLKGYAHLWTCWRSLQ
jgi:hypothetical protein